MSEYPDFYVEKIVVARKQHRCCECRRKMKVGERHQVCSLKYDGEIDRYRTCRLCLKLLEVIKTSDIHDDESYIITRMIESVFDYENKLFIHMAERILRIARKGENT